MLGSENKTTFTIELSEVEKVNGEGSLFYCSIYKNGKRLHIRQSPTADGACLSALQLISKHFYDLDLETP